ncbi:MAG: hypothetical protein JWQ09_2059 [Segetibacter sp.]|nr:hypothetical protein [Segetibacter sp.]
MPEIVFRFCYQPVIELVMISLRVIFVAAFVLYSTPVARPDEPVQTGVTPWY